MFELLPIGAYRSSADGKQVRANAALVTLNGYESEEEMFPDGHFKFPHLWPVKFH